MIVLTLFLALLVVAVAAPLVGVDTTDGYASAEWERRRTWRSSHNR
jgi:hypothetical protein